MNNEKYNQIIDEVYGNYITYIHDVVQEQYQIYGDWYGKEEFINKCKTDPEFSEKWGLKIVETELSFEERYEIRCKRENIRNDWEQFYYTFGGYKDEMNSLKKSLERDNIPTKLITLTYNNETIEVYEI